MLGILRLIVCCIALSKYLDKFFMNDLISFGRSSNLLYNSWNRFLAVFSVVDLKIKLVFFTRLSSCFNLFVNFLFLDFFSLNFLFSFLFSWLSFCLCVSFFRVLSFCPLYLHLFHLFIFLILLFQYLIFLFFY